MYFALNTLVLIVDSYFYKGSMMILKNDKVSAVRGRPNGQHPNSAGVCSTWRSLSLSLCRCVWSTMVQGQKVYLDGDMARFDEHITFRLRSGYRSRHSTAAGGKGKIAPDEVSTAQPLGCRNVRRRVCLCCDCV